MSDRDETLFRGNLHATGLALSESAKSGQDPLRKMALSHLDIDGIEGTLGDLAYRAARVSLDGLQGIVGRKRITAEAADMADLLLENGAVRLGVRRMSCPSGVLAAGAHEILAPHVSFEDVHLSLDVSRLLDRDPKPEPAVQAQPIDLHCLDALQGQLDIDLAVDMTLPWIGRRNVTHYFRIPIDNGTIDFERLEDDVHWLEATFLTVDLVDDRLVLARDLPLVPYPKKALLWWQLESKDIPVAAMNRVHVRNLIRPRTPDESSGKRKKLILHALAMQNIKLELHADQPVQLSLPSGAMLQFGDDDSAGLAGLTLEGELRFRGPDQNGATEDADGDNGGETSLHGSVALLDVTLQDLAIGSAGVSVDRLHIGNIEHIEVAFEGFRPCRMELSIGRMAATNLRIQMAR